jgi:hypothetical protein
LALVASNDELTASVVNKRQLIITSIDPTTKEGIITNA